MRLLKTLFSLSHVLVGIVLAYLFWIGEIPTKDLWLALLGLMIVADGLRMVLEDRNAAAANVFRRSRNGFFIVLLMLGAWWLLRQF